MGKKGQFVQLSLPYPQLPPLPSPPPCKPTAVWGLSMGASLYRYKLLNYICLTSQGVDCISLPLLIFSHEGVSSV